MRGVSCPSATAHGAFSARLGWPAEWQKADTAVDGKGKTEIETIITSKEISTVIMIALIIAILWHAE